MPYTKKFKPKIDLLITSIYLPHDPRERETAILSLTKFLREHNNKQHVLCGDFNTYPVYAPAINASTTRQKRKIYNFLRTWIDVAKATNQQKNFSHITKTSMSRIDQIWTSSTLAQRIIDYKCHTQSIINSDHNALSKRVKAADENASEATPVGD